MEIKNIAIHHSGGLQSNYYASTKHLTFSNINQAHKDRWPDFKSTLGHYGGYNFAINPFGQWIQFRAIGEETAAQRGHNFDTISFCLIGNFSINPKTGVMVDAPTEEQTRTLVDLATSIMEGNFKEKNIAVIQGTRLNLSFDRIYPHRGLQSGTECYGNALSNNWGKQLFIPYIQGKITLLQTLVELYNKYIQLRMQSLAGERSSCLYENTRG